MSSESSTSAMAAMKKKKEDALKKQTGELPPDMDQDGKMINPHNPEFITKVPWYLGDSGPTLKHHSVQKHEHVLSMAETDALVSEKFRAQQAVKSSGLRSGAFQKGACKNCGSMTHKEKDCVERPRSKAKSAWKTGVGMAPSNSDVTLELNRFGKVSYDGKRDQWAGYDPSEHRATVERYERVEREREAKLKEEKLRRQREDQQKSADRKAEKLRRREAGRARGDGAESEDSVDSDVDSDTDADSDSDCESGDSSDEEVMTAKANRRDYKAKDEKAGDFQSRHSRQGGVGGAQMKVTVRDLRVREDTPKYLRNLALESAHYDPKSRSMRSNPNPHENPETAIYAGDNFVRHSGDALKLAQTQVLCWDMQQHAESATAEEDNQIAIDLLSNPSRAEMVMKEYSEKKQVMDQQLKEDILRKYGTSGSSVGADGVQSGSSKINTVIRDSEEELEQSSIQSGPPSNTAVTASLSDARLRLGQTESYSQYSKDGRVVTGSATGVSAGTSVRRASKYEEDVTINNHTSVWGSYYNRRLGKWGYECCHSLMYNSFCTGAVGKEANDAEQAGSLDLNSAKKMLAFRAQTSESEKEKGKEKNGRGSSDGSGVHPNSTRNSQAFSKSSQDVLDPSYSESLDKAKLSAAMDRERQRNALETNRSNAVSEEDRKRRYNSGGGDLDPADLTAEDMEAYRLKRTKTDDPMAKLLDSDVLLEYK